jgi:hypothetical protein
MSASSISRSASSSSSCTPFWRCSTTHATPVNPEDSAALMGWELTASMEACRSRSDASSFWTEGSTRWR